MRTQLSSSARALQSLVQMERGATVLMKSDLLVVCVLCVSIIDSPLFSV